MEDKPKGQRYEFHLHKGMVIDPENPEEDLVEAEGFLKFGPQFVAVVAGPEDTADITFAVSTPLIRYVKRIGVNGEVEGTLSLT